MFFVYIIQGNSGHFYKGLTNNLEKRMKDHESGKVNATKNLFPFKLIHVELCKTREEARKMEKFFKSGFGREIIKEIR